MIEHRRLELIRKFFLMVILLGLFATGCTPTILNIGLLEAGRNNFREEFYVDNFKIKIKIFAITDMEYLYSISFFDKYDGSRLTKVKSEIEIKKFRNSLTMKRKSKQGRLFHVSDLKPFLDDKSKDYDFKYKFDSSGKYQISIKLSEVDGKQLEKETHIIFEQEI